ncbi:MAG: hypothetical protein HY904_18220 [Deltaproteobacteria bacterium]|nr:hypothetical protein [Deltaproteobacteria bacterium]
MTAVWVAVLLAGATPVADEELPTQDARSAAVSPGVKGGCLGGGIGFCLGLGLPGACVGCFLGNWIENLQTKVDDAEAAEQEAKDQALEAEQRACEEARAHAPPGTAAATAECAGKEGLPWRQVLLGGAGTVGGVLIGVAALVAAGVMETGTLYLFSLFIASNASTAQGVLLAGTLTATVGLLVALVVANVVGGAAWSPYALWWVRDQF